MAEAVAGWLVSPIIKILADKARSCVSDRVKWLGSGVPEALDQLEKTLDQLRAVEQRSSPGNSVHLRRWLQQLKDAVSEANNVLDDSVPRPNSSGVRIVKRILGADEDLNKLKDVVKKLEAVSATSIALMTAAAGHASASASASGELSCHRPPPSRDTGSMRLSGHAVFGRDKELREMVSWLVGGASDGDSTPLAAIMGHGGMGKTTLAQLLLEDHTVASTFDLKIWVRPAAMDNELELARQILQSASVDVPDNMKSFDRLQKNLKEAVSSRKFLLVIDDVWSWNMEELEYRQMWSKVLAPLSRGADGKIVITTRQKIVARWLDASKQVWLDGLRDDDIWSLFTTCAFGQENIDKQPPVLLNIGRRIVEKLKGSPMVAEAVGQMLKGTHKDTKWKEVLDMNMFDKVSSTLELCYHKLPEYLKQCFAICSIFPKNWKFKRDRLVKIWMALDFIQATDVGTRLEDVGSNYFDQLLDRSFFHRQKVGRRRYYYIHDLMHDLAEKVSEDCMRVEGVNKEILKKVRHLSVSTDALAQPDAMAQLKSRCELKRLQTLVILNNPSSPLNQLPGDLFKELKDLRVLCLEGCNIVDLSEKISHSKYLRYLAICKSITRLPQAVTKLYHLQTLRCPKGSRLEAIPKDFTNLKCLRHSDIDTSKIAGIGKLVHLQGSIEFHVKNERGHTLVDLNGMSSLRKELHIKNLDVVTSQQEACKAGLNKKENVKVLELEWNSSGRSMPSDGAEVLDGLEPHQLVKKLHIRRYPGNRSPNWLKESDLYLKYLYLTNCRKWEDLPPLGQLPYLKVLHLKEMCSLKRISSEFYGTNPIAFPCLEELEFDDMPQWVKWTQEEKNTSVLPKLYKLELLNCPELIKVPPLPQSVRKVTVKNSGFISQLKLSPLSSSSSKGCKFELDTCSATVLTDGLLHQQQMEAIAILTLRNCQDVKFEELQALTSLKSLNLNHSDINDGQLDTCLQGLQALSSLGILNCSNITSLPRIESPGCLTQFHELSIQQCSGFSSLKSLPSYVALKSMLIDNCSKVTVESFPTSFESTSSLMILRIMNCAELESLPSGFPPSLQVLHLIGCKSTLVDQLQLKAGPEWDKVACIPRKLIR